MSLPKIILADYTFPGDVHDAHAMLHSTSNANIQATAHTVHPLYIQRQQAAYKLERRAPGSAMSSACLQISPPSRKAAASFARCIPYAHTSRHTNKKADTGDATAHAHTDAHQAQSHSSTAAATSYPAAVLHRSAATVPATQLTYMQPPGFTIPEPRQLALHTAHRHQW